MIRLPFSISHWPHASHATTYVRNARDALQALRTHERNIDYRLSPRDYHRCLSVIAQALQEQEVAA